MSTPPKLKLDPRSHAGQQHHQPSGDYELISSRHPAVGDKHGPGPRRGPQDRDVAAYRRYVGPDATLTVVARIMRSRGFADLPVLNDRGAVIGMITPADLVEVLIDSERHHHSVQEECPSSVP